MVRSNPFSTSEEASALSASSEASVVADTFGLLRTMSKYIAFVSVPRKSGISVSYKSNCRFASTLNILSFQNSLLQLN